MKKLLILPLLVLLLQAPLFAGVVFEVDTKDHSDSPPSTEVMELSAQGRLLKMSFGSGRDKGEMIYRGDRREMVVVDHSNQSFMVMDEAAIQALSNQLGAAMKELEGLMENIPAEQRAQMEAMMKGRLPQAQPKAEEKPEIDVRRTGDEATRGKYPAERYEAIAGNKKQAEFWVTGWQHIEDGSDVSDTFEEMVNFLEDMLSSLSSASGFSNFAPMSTEVFMHFTELNGFPVETKTFGEDGSLEAESSLRSVTPRRLDPADFEPPAGYKRQSMPGI